MRKIYSLVLMATMLLIGTNAWAVYPAGWLQDRFDEIEADGQTHTIVMEDDITLTAPVYLGTATVDEERKSIILDMNGHHITMSATDWVASKGNVYCHMFTITHGELLVRNNASDKATNPSKIQMIGTGYDKYNNIFNVAGSYKSSRWQKSGDEYEVPADAGDDIASVGINTRNKGWFTHLEIGEGVKLVAANTISGAGISMDGYYTLYHALVSSAESYVKGNNRTFGNIGLNDNKIENICLYGRSDAPAYNTTLLSASAAEGVAYGLRVDVYGDIEFATGSNSGLSYGIKLNGGIRSSLRENERFLNTYCWPMDQAYAKTYGATAPTTDATKKFTIVDPYYTNHRLDTIDAPFLYVHSSAHITAAAELNEATAVYCSGYGKALIEGACSGNSGVNIKSGRVELHDAEITCTATPTSVYPAKNGNNATGTGAVVVNSVDNRAGGIEVIISGDSKVSTDYGYAIAETVTATDNETKVTSVVIEGGTIQGGAATGTTGGGAILVSETTKQDDDAEVVIYGANLTGNNEVEVGGGTLRDLLPINEQTSQPEGHVTPVTDPVTGKTTLVISAGPEPVAEDNQNSWADVAAYAYPAHSLVVWTGTGNPENTDPSANNGYGVIESGTVTLGELQMISGNAAGNKQVLRIKDGACLDVQHLIMNDFAQIIVEAGGKLIVEGTQGIVANDVDNIKLESNATKQAIFLFNPGVNSNKHPNATVQYVATKSYRVSANDYQWERFGVPTWKALNSIKCTTTDVYSYVRVYENGWQDLGWIHNDDEFANLARMNKPFATYNMLTYVDDKELGHEKATYVMTGELVGNMDATLNANLEWNAFTNSYSAEIDVKEMLLSLANTNYIEKGVYTAQGGGNGIYVWDAVDLTWIDKKEDKQKLAPMQAFILRNEGLIVEDFTLDYENMVWDPVMDPNHQVASVSGAPRRAGSADDESARLRIIVANEQGAWDNVKMTENATASSLKKYMNDDVNIYAMADEKAAIVAAEDLEDSYFGFSTVKGGEFTISFADVEGREFDLIDLETGVKVAVMEGETYSFAAAANTVADYRFKLVERAQMPTAIENTEAVKSVKGIYTITGQYLGEMNVWNTLPAGVYVVNGEKLVK